MRTKKLFYIFIVLMINVSFLQCDKGEEPQKEEQQDANRRKDYDSGYYIGEFNKSGQAHGQGIYYWNNGHKYEGTWENGKRTGQGTYTWPSGEKYIGNWLNGNRSGQGTYTVKDGSTFTCEWKDDEPTDEKCYLLWLLKDWYLWANEIGKIDAKDYTSAEDLLAKKRYSQDKNSFIEDIETGYKSLFFESQELGYGFGMRWDANRENLRVSYVHSNSPGGINGLKRGWKITHIDGGDVTAMTSIPSNSVEQEGLTRSFTVEDETGTSKTIFLRSSIYNGQTVLHNSVIQHNGKAVGYLSIKSFISQSPDALLSAASSLAGSGISELILDMRYCSGGSYSVLNDFVGIIAPKALNNLAYLKRNYNSAHTDSDTAYIIRKTGSLNLNRIFVITSANTSNLPEDLINGLSSYMNIIRIGDKTGGSGYGTNYWTFGQKLHYLVTAKMTNAQNESSVNGISPDYYAADGVDKPWGDKNEDCIQVALFYIGNGHFPATGKSSSSILKSFATQRPPIIESVRPAEILPIPNETFNMPND
jgi:C-terminal processing protease CtpA/Prc